MIPFLILGLAGFWVFLLWRVRVERGRVRDDPFARFLRAMREVEEAVGAALLPVVSATMIRIERFAEVLGR